MIIIRLILSVALAVCILIFLAGLCMCVVVLWSYTRVNIQEAREKKSRDLEFERWKNHRGEVPPPLPRWMVRMGDYAGI